MSHELPALQAKLKARQNKPGFEANVELIQTRIAEITSAPPPPPPPSPPPPPPPPPAPSAEPDPGDLAALYDQ